MDSEVPIVNKVYRSSSHSDVFCPDESTSPHDNATPTSAAESSTSSGEIFGAASKIINAQPQDFVIVNGKPFRVSRTPRHAPPDAFGSSTASDTALSSFEEFRAHYSGRTFDDLLLELFESRRTIHRQELELRKLKTSEVAATPDLTSIRNRASTASKIALRQRLRVSEAAGTDSPNTGAIDTIASHAFPTISPKSTDLISGGAADGHSKSPDDPKTSLRFGVDPPKSLRIDVSRSAMSAGGGKYATEEEYNAFLRLSATAPASSSALEGFNPDIDLPAEPGSAQLDRRKSRLPVAQRIRNLHLETPADVSPERVPKRKATIASTVAVGTGISLFDWQSRLRDPGAPAAADGNKTKKYPILLFIVHDNPMLGNAAEAACKSGDLMPVMLETKDDAGISYFIIATIIHSGAMETIAGANPDHPRGSQCMVCGEIIAIKSKLKELPTRSKPGHGDIIEVDLAHLPKESFIDVSGPEKLKKFLAPCTARVDVIMDPSRNDPAWYPYWEGTRKMAPQFRSRGIGYIRLGDDMSMNGTAFLSTDAGASFLDDGKNSVEARETKSVINTGNSASSTRKRTDSTEDGEHTARPHSQRGRSSMGSRGQPQSSSAASSAIKSILHSIRHYDNVSIGSTTITLSWSERVTALQKLQKDIQDYPVSEVVPDWLGEAIIVLAESIVKQKNPNVAKELLLTVNTIAPFLAVDSQTDSGLALGLRSLVLEIVHLLRHANKGISDAARASLDRFMNVNALSLSSLTRLNPSVYTELLFGPNKSSTGKAATSTAANTSKVLQWLTDFVMLSRNSVSKEDVPKICADLLRPLKGFISHREESTRDASINLFSHLILIDLVVTQRTPNAEKMTTSEPTWPSTIQPLVDRISPETFLLLVQIDKDYPKISQRLTRDSLAMFSTVDAAPVATSSKATSVSANPSNIRLKRSNSSGTAGLAQSSADASSSDTRGLTSSDSQKLDNEWFEAKLVLKKVPSDLNSWNNMLEVVDRSADFFKSINTTASNYSVPIGKFLRILLPFDESTSSGDQAAISDVHAYDVADTSIPPDLLRKYRPFAVSLRSLIRVKMADEADLQQAQTVMKQLKSFCDNVRNISSTSGISVMELLAFA